MLGLGDDGLFAALFQKFHNCSHFGEHTAFGKMTFINILTGLGQRQSRKWFFLWRAVIEADVVYSGRNDQGLGTQISCQQGRRIILIDHRINAFE